MFRLVYIDNGLWNCRSVVLNYFCSTPHSKLFLFNTSYHFNQILRPGAISIQSELVKNIDFIDLKITVIVFSSSYFALNLKFSSSRLNNLRSMCAIGLEFEFLQKTNVISLFIDILLVDVILFTFSQICDFRCNANTGCCILAWLHNRIGFGGISYILVGMGGNLLAGSVLRTISRWCSDRLSHWIPVLLVWF